VFTIIFRCLITIVCFVLLAACGTSSPSPASTIAPTELPTATVVPTTAIPPTLSPDAQPGLSNLRFATRQDLTDAQGDGAVFQAGLSSVWVAVDCRDLPEGTELIWRMEGGSIEGSQTQPLADTSGTVLLDLFGAEHAALPGDYRVTVRTNKQVLTAAFSIDAAGLKPGDVIVSDRFDNDALGWDLSSSPIGAAEVVDGELKLTVKWKHQDIMTFAPYRVTDFDLSVEVKHEKGPIDGFAAIGFGRNYVIEMFVGGGVSVNRMGGDTLTNVLSVAPEASFRPYATNTVRVILRDGELEIYRNDVLLGSIYEEDIETGPIWFGAWTLSEGGLIVSFDNLTVRVPVEVPAKSARR
jgi:hypothetical protein